MNQFAAFAMTLAIELPLIALAARRLQPAVSWRRVAAAGVAASSLTHPLAWWLRWHSPQTAAASAPSVGQPPGLSSPLGALAEAASGARARTRIRR